MARPSSEDRARGAKRLEMVMRLQIAREQVGEVWRDAGSPPQMEAKLREIERDLMGCEKVLRDTA